MESASSELILETLRIAEVKELDYEGPPHIYTCLLKDHDIASSTASNLFADIVLTGELCVCAGDPQVARLLFFLIQGVFDHQSDKYKWYTEALESRINLEYDDVTPEEALAAWADYYDSIAEVREHNISQPIVTYPMERGMVTLTPSICDIWTLPRIRRQFSE